MTSREFFVEALKDELPRFERVLKALPEARLGFRPHEKSRSARELVGLFADEAKMFVTILQKGEIEMSGYAPGQYDTLGDALAPFGRAVAEAQGAAASLSEDDWMRPARLTVEGKVEWETTRGQMAWGLLLDLIHHRGQLSVYIRPMGGQVPAIYGPSGDASA